MRLALQGTTAHQLAQTCGIDLGDARKILSKVHRTGALPQCAFAGIRRTSLERLRDQTSVPRLERVRRVASSVDPFVKCVFALHDGHTVESVCWPLERPERVVVCVSSQAGCALGCAFCATGRLGLMRNLEAWEIVEQVLRMRDELGPGQHVHGVVFQGMGEPLANADQVIQAIRVLSEPYAPAIDRRKITVSTAGLPKGILRLGREVPEVRVGLSIGCARPEERARLMPIDRRYPLEEVIQACAEHARLTGQSPMFAYTLIRDRTDSAEDALSLADLAQRFVALCGRRPRISLIPFNRISGSDFEAPSDERVAAFRALVHGAGFGTKLRYSGGGDMAAACGQLVGR